MSGVSIEKNGDVLIAYLKGDIDHHTAQKMKTRLDSEIMYHSCKLVILDFSGVGFMDSSGIGLILGRLKLISTIKARLSVQGVPVNMMKILKLAGITHIITEKKEMSK